MTTHEKHPNRRFNHENPGSKVGTPGDDRFGGSADETGPGAAIHKMSAIVSGKSKFYPEDYRQFARYFDIPVADAEQVAALLSGCFDLNGRFQRETFEKYLPEFSRYDKNIFQIFWNCLNISLDRNDRVAFLNSMQLLIVRLKQPKKALKTLLNDFTHDPDGIADSDRDALMLSNLLIRKYNKELYTDIETTPEEVLLVKNGLDRDMTKYAQWRIESAGEVFQHKIHTIGTRIVSAIDAGKKEADGLSVDFLLSLDREVQMFLSLVGGDAAYRIIRSAVEAYGNPENRIFKFSNSFKYLPMLLQHLKVLVRGLGRVGGKQDLQLFQEIKQHEAAFIQFGDDPGYHGLVRQVLQWVDISIDRAAANPAN
ncbi:MAG: hypothetical protein JRD49_02955 [Deltaproteobacteria bacterium]|nr:hypothetical protein [Deltaproteobacteria bacterium]